MSKTLKIAALVVGAVALAATGIGAAASAGLLGAAAATSGAVVVAGLTASSLMAIGALAGVAASLLTIGAQLTAKKPSAAAATGSQTTFAADPDAGIPLVLGRTGTAGNIVFRQGFDTAAEGVNDRQSFVSALSLGPVKAIEGQTVDRSPVSYAAGAALGAFAGFMWSMTQLGALPEPAALGFGAGAGTPPSWTAQHKLSGLAAASWTLRFDTKAKMFQTGVPAPIWTVQGALAYDPRKDSTYPGGSGPHRMADPANRAAYDAAVATWEWTEDPYLLGLRWAHGVWQRDMSDPTSNWTRVMGMGAPAAAIDTAAFVEGANVAAANGWSAGGVVFSGDDKWDSLKKILQAGMGEPLALGARISCTVNAPKVSLATITTADLRGPGSVSATQPRRDRINSVTPRYRLEANNWRLLPAAPITVSQYVTADRGKRSKAIDYAFIQNSAQAGVAARYDIENAREFGPVVLPLGLAWMGYKPGDCVTVTVPELGLNAQQVQLLNRGLEPSTGIVTLTGRSETAGKHAYALGQVATPPATPGVTGPALVPVPHEGAWTLAAGTSSIPALAVTGAVDAGTADAVVFEYRRFVTGQAADAGWRGAGVEPPSLLRKEISPVAGVTQYEVAVSYQARGVTGGRRILGPITTGAEVVGQAGAPGPQGPQGIPGGVGPAGQTSYVHIAYADAADGSANFTTGAPGGRFYIGLYQDFTAASSSNPASYFWSKWRGADGSNGVPGLPGANGLTPYTHFAYSSSADGSASFHTSDPLGRAYLGVYTDYTEPDSGDYHAYTWSLIKGADGADGAPGIPGVAGANGQTSYTHLAYADSADGSVNFVSGSAAGGRFYVGVYQDFTAAGSLSPSAYNWSKWRGEDGNGIPGAPGANGLTPYTHFAYSSSADGSASFHTSDPTGRAYLGVYTDYTEPDSGDYHAYTWSLIKGSDGSPGAPGANGSQGPQGIPGTAGPAGQTSYTHLAYADSADGSTNFTTGAAGDRFYVGVYQDFNATGSGSPGTYYWSRWRGADGSNGIAGPPGANGQATYVHIAYATAADGSTGFSTSDGTNRTYVGTYTDGTLTDSTNPALYTWSLIKGSDGAPGMPGAPGQSATSWDLNKLAIEVAADAQGNLKPGALPVDVVVKVINGSTDVTGSAGVTLTPSSGITASYSAGVITITGATASGVLTVSVTYGGSSVGSKQIQITKTIDNPAASVSSVSGSVNIYMPGGSNAFDDTRAAGALSLAPNASGEIVCNAYVTYGSNFQRLGNYGYSGSFTAVGRFQYRESGSDTWLAANSAQSGSEAVHFEVNSDPEQNDIHGGELSMTFTLGGLDPTKVYDLRLQTYRDASTSPGASANSVNGTQAYSR